MLKVMPFNAASLSHDVVAYFIVVIADVIVVVDSLLRFSVARQAVDRSQLSSRH